MNPFEKIKLNSSEIEKDEKDFGKIDISPTELEELGKELSDETGVKETGISRGFFEKIARNRRLREIFSLFLLTSGLNSAVLFADLENAFAEGTGKVKGNLAQIDYRSNKSVEEETSETKEMKEKLNEMKGKFIDFMKELQERKVITYNGGEDRGIQEAVVGKVGKYNIECLFHHYSWGAEKGKITGGDNERIEVSFVDEAGTDYQVGSRFGNFKGYAFNFEEKEGFKKMSIEDLAMDYGIILGRKDVEFAFIKDLSPQEMENIMNDVSQQAIK